MKDMIETWPNFFIVGAPRCGTTTLYAFLNKTKGVYMSPHKEPHYFTKSVETSNLYQPIQDKKKYLALFEKGKDNKAIGEASTSYLWDPKAPMLIHDIVPKAKIIIMLRNPIERAYSYYLWRISNGKTYSFREAIDESLESKNDFYKGLIINGGKYYEQVQRYLNIFGSNQVKVLKFEEFIKNTKKTVMDVLKFLEIDAEPPESVELVHNTLTVPKGKLSTILLQNRKIKKIGKKILPNNLVEYLAKTVLGKKIAKPKMQQKDRIFLGNLYFEDVEKLQELLKRDFEWKLD